VGAEQVDVSARILRDPVGRRGIGS
jgi:hypothetical protein